MANINISTSDLTIRDNTVAEITIESYGLNTVASLILVEQFTEYESNQNSVVPIDFNTSTGILTYTVTKGILPYSIYVNAIVTMSDGEILLLDDVTLLPNASNSFTVADETLDVVSTTSIIRDYTGFEPVAGFQFEYPSVIGTFWELTVFPDSTYELLWTDSENDPDQTPIILNISVWNNFAWEDYAVTLNVTYPEINVAPVADFTYTTDGLTFNGDATISSDGNDDVLTYSWDFGDGSTATTLVVEHTYALSGDYNVTLVVNDGTVDSAPEIKSINVDNAVVLDPIAEFTFSTNLLTVNVDASLSFNPNNENVVYVWDFGDSTSLVTGEQQTHEYAATGDYTITLSMQTDLAVELDTEEKLISVSSDSNGITAINGGAPIVAGNSFTITTQGIAPENIHFIELSTTGYSVRLPRDSIVNENTITVLAPVDLPVVTNNLTINIRVWKYNDAPTLSASFVWSEIEKSENFVAPSNTGHKIDTRNGSVMMVLPPNPTVGEVIKYLDLYGSFGTNNFIINPGVNNFYGAVENYTSSSNNESGSLFYTGSSQGWKFIDVSPTI